jgi:hypothetical protein
MAVTLTLVRLTLQAKKTLDCLNNLVPGKHWLGPYRYLPFFFVLGGYIQFEAFRLADREEIEISTGLFSCFCPTAGLPDFSWCNNPNWGKMYENSQKNTSNGHKIFQVALFVLGSRVARFFLAQHTKMGGNVLNCHKIYQMALK